MAVALTAGRAACGLGLVTTETLKVWDVETGEALRTLEGHSGGVSGGGADRRTGGRAVSASDKTRR